MRKLNQLETKNSNKLIESVKRKLGKELTDSHDMLLYYVTNSITIFNSVPYFSYVTLEDTEILQKHHDIFVQGAVLTALSIAEISNKYNLFLDYTKTKLSDMLKTKFSQEWDEQFDAIKMIKNSWKKDESN